MAIQFELYKTPRPKDEADKETYHARVVNFQHIDTDYPEKSVLRAAAFVGQRADELYVGFCHRCFSMV